MDREKYKNIDGIETFWKFFPDKPWHYFHDILEFRWYQEFDCANGIIELILNYK